MVEKTPHETRKLLQADGLTLDIESRLITGCGEPKSLSPKECQLLALFMSYPGQVLSRKLVMKKVWETDYLDDTRTLEVHICYLRRKIEVDPYHPQRLRTVHGVGYRFGE